MQARMRSVTDDDVVAVLYRAGRSALGGSVAAAIIVSALLWGPETRAYLLAWLCVLAAASLWRVRILR
jgi:hypothetical protein